MALLRKWRGCILNWIDDSRDGLPRTDLFSPAHVFNPYYFDEYGGACACRACAPLLWQYEPLPLTFDSWLPTEPPRAKNGVPWADLDAELFARLS